MPTTEQIAQAKKNAEAMKAWINHAHDYLQDPLNEVYQKLSQSPESDPGQEWVTRINDVVFSVISAVDFPGAGVGADFLQSLLGSYADTNTQPDSLKKVFGDVWARFSATFLQANDDLGVILADPEAVWDKTYTSSSLSITASVSSLGREDFIFPTETGDPVAYNELTDKLVASFRYNLTKNVIGARWSILHDPNVNFEDGWTDNDAKAFAEQQVHGHRDIYVVWHPDQGGTCAGCPSNGMSWSEPRLGIGDWASSWDYFHGESAPQDMCDWLIKDDGYGNTLNPDAIATRKEVFCEWPIPGNLNEHPAMPAPAEKDVEPDASEHDKFLAARWHELFRHIDRQRVEAILVSKALRDPAFKRDLIARPKETISREVGISFPSTARVDVIQERAGEYTLVIPRIGRPVKRGWWKRWLTYLFI